MTVKMIFSALFSPRKSPFPEKPEKPLDGSTTGIPTFPVTTTGVPAFPDFSRGSGNAKTHGPQGLCVPGFPASQSLWERCKLLNLLPFPRSQAFPLLKERGGSLGTPLLLCQEFVKWTC